MKKIITSTILFGMFAFATSLSAQSISSEHRKALQTDNIESFKKAVSKADYDKCLQVKEGKYTMLSYSIKNDKNNIFNFLLSNKSDVNKSCDGVTPLMIAAKYGRMDMAKNLLKNGADKSAKDANGKTAKDYAVQNKQDAMAMVL